MLGDVGMVCSLSTTLAKWQSVVAFDKVEHKSMGYYTELRHKVSFCTRVKTKLCAAAEYNKDQGNVSKRTINNEMESLVGEQAFHSYL